MSKVNNETATKEFERFADTMCIDIDVESMAEDDVTSFEEQKKRLVKAITVGSLVIKENGEPVYTPVRSERQEPLTFYEPTGAVMLAMDKRSKGQDFAKLYETMGAITRTNAVRFSKMAMADLKVCQAITILFLA